MMRTLRIAILVSIPLAIVAQSAKFLVVDQPRKADTILVLAGETGRRPARALDLFRQGYAGRVIVDVPADAQIYGSTLVELARTWISSLPEGSAIEICPIHGLSTKAESLEAAECLRNVNGHSVLLVTSDFHTRRALSVFRREIPGKDFSVAAAYDSSQFGPQWWRHRQWAKTNLDEWLRLIWWQLIDTWL